MQPRRCSKRVGHRMGFLPWGTFAPRAVASARDAFGRFARCAPVMPRTQQLTRTY